MAILISDIKTLVNTRKDNAVLRGSDLSQLPCLDDAYLVIEGNHIADYGRMNDLKHPRSYYQQNISARDRMILPSWCDSHTHLVFTGSRENEFVNKIKGKTYAQIAAEGGGILNSAKKLNETSEDELFHQASSRLQEVMRLGTGAIEIKSGYGLTIDGELKMLRVIQRLKQSFNIPIKATFLGAHTIPPEYRQDREAYLRLIIEEMLPVIREKKLADFIDVFCEEGFFTPAETEKICRAGKDAGLKPKIHANQLSLSGGVQAGIKAGAVSVDHLECMDDASISTLANSSTIGTLLPTAAFFLRMQLQEARKMIESNCSIAIASDFNPGSSPSGNMNFVVALSCIQMKMLPEEAINAATINGAHAMELGDEVGSIAVGKKANIILTKPVPSIAYLPYAFGSNHLEKVMVSGTFYE